MLRKLYYIAIFFVTLLVCNISRAQISIETLSNISFGNIIFAQSHSAILRLGTNGNLNVTGSGIETSGMPTAGEISIASQDSGTVEVRCSAGGSLSPESGGNSVQMQNAEISVNVGRNFGSGNKCSGISAVEPAVLHDLGNTVPARILVGVEIDLVNGRLSGSGEYSTGSGGGTPISIDVIFQ